MRAQATNIGRVIVVLLACFLYAGRRGRGRIPHAIWISIAVSRVGSVPLLAGLLVAAACGEVPVAPNVRIAHGLGTPVVTIILFALRKVSDCRAWHVLSG